MREDNETLKAATKEEEIVSALGITMTGFTTELPTANQDTGEHVVVPDPHADEVDLSDLRGTKAPTKGPHDMSTCLIWFLAVEYSFLGKALTFFFVTNYEQWL